MVNKSPAISSIPTNLRLQDRKTFKRIICGAASRKVKGELVIIFKCLIFYVFKKTEADVPVAFGVCAYVAVT